MQTGVDGERLGRLDGTFLDSFQALGTWMGSTTTLVPSDVQKLAVDAAAEMTLAITTGKVW